MKFTKIKAGTYKSENGYTIKQHTGYNMFTGKPMSEGVWQIFNRDGEKIDVAATLKQAKTYVEKYYAD